MKKTKSLIIGSIIILICVCVLIVKDNYLKDTTKETFVREYLALDTTTTLKNITIKKEIVDQKKYYTPGETLKYKITVTNNNSESVKVDLYDNYNNKEKIQNNLVLKSASCAGKTVTIKDNAIKLTDYEIVSKGSVVCEVTASTKENYFEGNVNSRAKVYIDDEKNYNESDFTYYVSDTGLKIDFNGFQRYRTYYKEPVTYEAKITNLNSEKASDKVVIIVESYIGFSISSNLNNAYEYSKSGATKELVDNSKIEISCEGSDGTKCITNPTQNQKVTVTIAGINPNETINLKINFIAPSVSVNRAFPFYSYIKEYKDDQLIRQTDSGYSIAIVPEASDVIPTMVPTDEKGNRLNDLHSLNFKDGKATMYLEFDYYRIASSSYGLSLNTSAVSPWLILPSNVTYDSAQKPTYEACESSDIKVEKTSDNLDKLTLSCSLAEKTTKAIVKVPITVDESSLNKYKIFDAFSMYSGSLIGGSGANRICVGADFSVNVKSAIQKNQVVDITLSVKNVRNLSNGRGEDLKLTYIYDEGLEIDESSLNGATIDKNTRTITWIIPLIRANETIDFTVTAKNTGDLEKLNIRGTLEDKDYSSSITIQDNGNSYLKGDWNQNGKVDVSDVIYARKYLAGFDGVTLPPVQIYDFNDDSTPTVTDLILLRKMISEM